MASTNPNPVIYLPTRSTLIPVTMTETTNLATTMDIDEAAIDEGLYSRQL